MISLFAKRDISSETRDAYGKWTVGAGNTSGGAYAHWKVNQLGAVKALAADARVYAGKRGENLRQKVFEANAREYTQRRQSDPKKWSQIKVLNRLFDIHASNMGLVAPEEQSKVRASIFAYALQHNQGPYGKLTPSYQAMIQRKVKAALDAQKQTMATAMTAKKPRVAGAKAKTALDTGPKGTLVAPTGERATGIAKAYVLRKFNQEHDELGRFTGPGGSHDPTGNPVGRPSTGSSLSPGKSLALAGAKTAGMAAGGWAAGTAGKAAGGAIGAAIGGAVGNVPGEIIGQTIGSYAGNILGGLMGDYVGAKIGQNLLGIKEQMDQHPVGMGEAVGSMASMVPEAASLIPGARAAGGLIGAGAKLFNPGNVSLASHIASGAVDFGGIAAGQTIDRSVGAAAGKAAGRAVSKGLFDAPPKSYDGSFGSMAAQAPPHLFGPRAWQKIANTPFGAYVRQKVKETADKMDDAADAQGIGLKPAKPAHVMGAASNIQQQQEAERQREQQMLAQQAAQAQQQTQQQQQPGSAQGKPDDALAKSLFRKLDPATLPMRSPNDVVYRAYQTGGAANARFLARMQESDRKSRGAQSILAFAQPKAENLARQPDEDEQQYMQRVQQLMAQSVEMSDRLRPQLFSGGSQELRSTYQVRRKRAASIAKGDDRSQNVSETEALRSKTTQNDDDVNFTMDVEFAKDFNDDENLARGLVYGWASIIEKDGLAVFDHQGDRISSDDLMEAAHDFIKNSRQGGVLHDEFGHNIGHIVESVVFTKQLQHHLNIDLGRVGWLIGYQITDPRVKTLVKAKVLKAFSIGGRGKRVPVDAAAA